MTAAEVETRPVRVDDLVDLALLFATQRNTRHCWCMAFCASPTQFALGWLTGGNERRFGSLARESPVPMGVLATVDRQSVGWCACGPRSRYVAALDGRGTIMGDRARSEDDSVWLLPCLFVAAGFRGRGVTQTLATAAVELARHEGARAVEAWPYTGSDPGRGMPFTVGEAVFEQLGFRCVKRPAHERAIMRLELT